MLISHLLAIIWLLALFFELPQCNAAPLALKKESFGLQSVQEFCRGEGRLDDLKDLAADVYRKETGRFYVVSIKNRTQTGHFLYHFYPLEIYYILPKQTPKKLYKMRY